MTDWTKKKYDEYYNAYVPWLEDKYLAWFGENKTSYTAKGSFHFCVCPFLLPLCIPTPSLFFALSGFCADENDLEQLDKTKITGDKNIDAIQDGLNTGVTGQLKEGGLLGGVGDLVSKEGVNRAERGDSGLGEKDAIDKSKQQQKGWGDSIPGSSWVTGKK